MRILRVRFVVGKALEEEIQESRYKSSSSFWNNSISRSVKFINNQAFI